MKIAMPNTVKYGKRTVITLLLLISCVLTCLTAGCRTIGDAAGQQTVLGQNNRPGFASTTKTKYVEGTKNQYDVDDNPNLPPDPNQVRDVQISGYFQRYAKDIVKILKTKKGRPFSEATLEEDKRALMQKGWFIDVKPKVERTPTGYIVLFEFIERPMLDYVKIVGNKAHTRKVLMEEGNIKAGDALDPIAVHQAKERMEQFYRESGYYRVCVTVITGDKIGDRGAVFYISEGPRQRILDVDFEGNRIASSQRLKTLIQSKPGWFFWVNSEFTPKKLDEDIETLTTYYRKLGFFYAKIDRKFVETDGYTGWGQNRHWVKVKFLIDEGPRCRVGDVRFIGQKIFGDDELKKMMKLPKEKYFNQDMLESDMLRIKEKYGEYGYVFTRPAPDLRIDEDYVDIVINMTEGPRCYLESLKIEIVGNEGADPYTKLQPILNRMSLRPGDILSTKEINNSKRRLRASQLFNANPTQGVMPDIIFTYPEEAIEDERKADELAAVRGQVAPKSVVPFCLLAENCADTKVEPTDTELIDEEDLNVFSEYFQIRCPDFSNIEQQLTEQLFIPQPQQQNTPPQIQPVQPMLLNWTPKHNEMLPLKSGDDIYRGQLFVPPASQPNNTVLQNIVPQSAVQNSTMLNYVPPKYDDIANTNRPIAVPYPYQTAPPPVQAATLFDAAGNGTLVQQTSTQTGNYTGTNTTALYTPPVNINQPNGLSGVPYPTDHLSPQTNQQYVGGAVLYNQGQVFTQESNQQPAGTDVILGNIVDNAINNSAYAFDPKNPYGAKTYPTPGVIKVQETRTGQLMMSVAVSSDAGLMGRFVLEEQNFDILNFPKGFYLRDWRNAFRGRGQRFRLEAVPGTRVQRYSASWETPYLFDLDYTFGVHGYYYQRYYDEWYEDRVGGGVTFGKLWTPDFTTRLSLGGQQVRIYQPQILSEDLYAALGRHPMYTIGLDAIHNTRDSEYMPTEGHMISVGVEQVLGDYQFVRGNIDIRKYFTLHERPDRSGRWVLGLRSNLGITEKGTPIYERYFGGGYTNLRGFNFRSVSPRNELGYVDGGCMEFYNSVEMVFPLTADDMIRGSLFLDTGTVERSIKKWESNYRVAAGFGLRLTIPMMGPAPIALDFAFPLSKGIGDEKEIFSFNVGFMR